MSHWTERMLALVLWVYPVEFRKRYAMELRLTFRDRATELEGRGGRSAVQWLLARELLAGLNAMTLGRASAAARVITDRARRNVGAPSPGPFRFRAKHRFESIAQDMRFAVRRLVKNRGVTAIAVITLAVGIGANTAIFSVVNGVLLRPLPYPDAEELTSLWRISPRGDLWVFSVPNFMDFRDQATRFENLAAYGSTSRDSSVVGRLHDRRADAAF